MFSGLRSSFRDKLEFQKFEITKPKNEKISYIDGKLTCVAWNWSRKTTFTFVFSNFHLVTLDIVRKINHTLYALLHKLKISFHSQLPHSVNCLLRWPPTQFLNAKRSKEFAFKSILFPWHKLKQSYCYDSCSIDQNFKSSSAIKKKKIKTSSNLGPTQILIKISQMK